MGTGLVCGRARHLTDPWTNGPCYTSKPTISECVGRRMFILDCLWQLGTLPNWPSSICKVLKQICHVKFYNLEVFNWMFLIKSSNNTVVQFNKIIMTLIQYRINIQHVFLIILFVFLPIRYLRLPFYIPVGSIKSASFPRPRSRYLHIHG